jgi:hypothetical protein
MYIISSHLKIGIMFLKMVMWRNNRERILFYNKNQLNAQENNTIQAQTILVGSLGNKVVTAETKHF